MKDKAFHRSVLMRLWHMGYPLALAILFILNGYGSQAQDTLIIQHLSLDEAIKMGLDNSKSLKFSKSKVDEAAAKVLETGDAQLPSAKANLAYSEAILLNNTFNIPGSSHPLVLPTLDPVYLGTLSINEALFAGHRLKYARQSAQLMEQIASLNEGNDRQGVILNIISEYYNLFKVIQSQRIIDSNLADIDDRLQETLKFEKQGLATQNDVLRWELQQSNIQITAVELEDNRRVISYDMDLLLGLPTNLSIEVDSAIVLEGSPGPLENYIMQADSSRQDLMGFAYQKQISDINIKSIKGNELPTLGVGFEMYYVNPNYSPIPPPGSLYLVPLTVGLNASWDIGTLWTSKHKLTEAQVQKQESVIGESELKDNISSEVHKDFTDYQQALKKIQLLTVAVDQAVENDRIMEDKYVNQLATTTDRIDAETMLYQAEINLELARVDAKLAYYNLLKSTGTIQ